MTLAAAFAAGAVAGGAASAFLVWRVMEERAQRYGRLFSFAMHEVNTPVTAVNMTVINLLSGIFGEVPPDQLKWIELTRDQISRLNALVGELRDLVHMEMGRDLRATVEPVDPAEMVDEALAAARRGMEQAGAVLAADVEKGLPRVSTDAERASRSLSSMLFHARKFRLSGGVAVRARRRGPVVAIEVEYAGQKLSPDEARAGLELFYPARRRKDQILAATGLGLGLSREVLRRVGADLELEVDPKGLAVLRMLLPAAGGS